MPLQDFNDLLRELAKFAPGDKTQLEYLRQVPDTNAPIPLEADELPGLPRQRFKMETFTVEVTLGKRPE